MIWNYFIVAFRNIWRSKLFSAINILGLSVGISCCLIIFLYVKNETSYDLFHKRKESIYQLTVDMQNPSGNVSKMSITGMVPGPAFKDQLPEVEDFVRLEETNFSVKRGAEVLDQTAFFADDNFFSVFTFPLLKGHAKTALKDLHAVVLSESAAQKYFGDQDPVGQILQMSAGKAFEPFTVTGVMKDAPQNSSIKPEMIVPMRLSQAGYDDKMWTNFFLNTFLVVKPGADLVQLEKKCNQIFLKDAAAQIKEMAEKYGMKDKIVFHLQALPALHLSEDYPATNGLSDASKPIYSYILSAIAAFILLIASFNFINLTVARSLKRSKEIGIRKAIGGLRSQLIGQFLGESLLVCSVAFLVAIALLQILLPVFNTLADRDLSLWSLFDWKLVLGFILLFFITGLLAGFYPALVLSALKPVDTLYGKTKYAGKNYVSRFLVVLQFALSVFLIISMVNIYRQFNFLVNFDLGYDDSQLLTIKTPPLNMEKLNLLKNELAQHPAIASVAGMQDGDNYTIAHINGSKEIDFNIKRVDANYLPTLKIPLTRGRNFSEEMQSDSVESVLVNEAFVKKAGWSLPLGQEVDFFYRNEKFKVIGVVKDYHFGSLKQQIAPELLHMRRTFNSYRKVLIKLKEGSTASVLPFVAAVHKRLYPDHPYAFSFRDQDNKEQYSSEEKWKQIIGFSAALTIFISCIGLFALSALSAERRSKEIGIRKVLGASVNGIVRHLSFDFLKLIVLASLIASPLAWWLLNKWLQNYPYHIELKIGVFGLTIALVLILAFVTICYQSIRAALANPVKSLRTE